jgi:hypothetical protein
MQQYTKLVVKKKIPPVTYETGAIHPDDPAASRYCRRCVHLMEPIKIGSGKVWHQCSQHSANPPCPFARNGHLPPSHELPKAKQEKSTSIKRKLWLEHNTVITPDNVKISGATVNNIGKKYNGKTYMEIFENGPQYVSWAIATAPPQSEASVELKHMASFFLEASRCKEKYQNEPDSNSPRASSSTTQPRGKSSFAKPKGKPKAAQPAHYNMAEETSEEDLDM